jgi:hypothetical protein
MLEFASKEDKQKMCLPSFCYWHPIPSSRGAETVKGQQATETQTQVE